MSGSKPGPAVAEYKSAPQLHRYTSAYVWKDQADAAIAELEDENKRLKEQFRVAFRLWLQHHYADLDELLKAEGA